MRVTVERVGGELISLKDFESCAYQFERCLGEI
jgi:hypothetical protein